MSMQMVFALSCGFGIYAGLTVVHLPWRRALPAMFAMCLAWSAFITLVHWLTN